MQREGVLSPSSRQGSVVEPSLDPRNVSTCLLVVCGAPKGTDLGTVWALSKYLLSE